MRATQHHKSRTAWRALPVAGALLAGLALAGCSAVNLTGFKMPSFGLMKDSDSDPVTTASIPEESRGENEKPASLIGR